MRFLGLVIERHHRDRPVKRKEPREPLGVPDAEILSYGDLTLKDEPRRAVLKHFCADDHHDAICRQCGAEYVEVGWAYVCQACWDSVLDNP